MIQYSVYAGWKYGGESGIRTHVTLSSKHAFQACAFSHSAISPHDRTVFVTKSAVGSYCRFFGNHRTTSILWPPALNCNQQQSAVRLSIRHSANSFVGGDGRMSFTQAGLCN